MINEMWEGLKQAIIRPVMASVRLIHPGKETNMGDLEKLTEKEEDSAAPEAVPETFTREEVVRMLQEMQRKALDVNGFIVGHVSQYWVVKVLIGEKILSLGGTEVEYKVI